MYITWCACCGYAMAVDNKKQKRCRWCRDGKPLQPTCKHPIPERKDAR